MKLLMSGVLLSLAALLSAPQASAKEAKPPSISQLSKACKADGSGCTELMAALDPAQHANSKVKKAVEMAGITCWQKKHSDSCYAAGKFLIATGTAENLNDGIRLVGESCDGNHLARCIEGQKLYLEANKNQKTIGLWIGMSATRSTLLRYHCDKKNEPTACKALGDELLFQATVEPNTNRPFSSMAIGRYRPSCDAGDAESCSRLVELYSTPKPSQGFSADTAVAKAFAVKSCGLGQTQHCTAGAQLAASDPNQIDPSLSYQEQMLVAELALEDGKTKMAMETLYRLAKENRDEANYRLGILFLSGTHGIAKDRSKGYYYLEQSGHPEAAYLRAQLAAQDNDGAAYNTYMDKAYWAGNKQAEVWWLNKQRAWLDAVEERDRRTIAQARENDRQKAAYEAELINRAMNNYYVPQDKEPTVCGLFREGGGMVNKCLSREYYTKKYVR